MNIQQLGTVTTFAIGEPATLDAVRHLFDLAGHESATYIEATGTWKGGQERSIIVKLAGIDAAQAHRTAVVLCRQFNQEAVYVERHGAASLVSR